MISIRKNSVMVALVKKEGQIYVGDEVVTTGKEFGVLYDDSSFGHVVGHLRNRPHERRAFDNADLYHIENPAIPNMDRTSVSRPMETGISGIDLIYPIGRGQRQLIIGDKKDR